jgi:hypothetical protein
VFTSKEKRGQMSGSFPWKALFSPQEFEFWSPLPVDQVARSLGREFKHRTSRQRPYRIVEVYPLDDGTYEYYVSVAGYIEASGYLYRAEGDATIMSGRVSAVGRAVWFFLLYALGMSAIGIIGSLTVIGTGHSPDLFPFGIFGFIGLIQLSVIGRYPGQLMKSIEAAMSEVATEKAKRRART